jgi:hypothetical protein
MSWLFSEQEYEEILSGRQISIEDDVAIRNAGFEFFLALNDKLKLYVFVPPSINPQSTHSSHFVMYDRPLGTLCTGMIYFHRFYMRHSVAKYPYKVRFTCPLLFIQTHTLVF